VIIHHRLLEEAGGFDETLPACEDYDLWLRIGCQHPIGLIERPLIVKRGGHADQLSSSTKALDRYRIQSLVKLIRRGNLSSSQREQAMAALKRKCKVYGQGCVKRGRIEEAEHILLLPENILGEPELRLRGPIQ
jgi:hypothetical protein